MLRVGISTINARKDNAWRIRVPNDGCPD